MKKTIFRISKMDCPSEEQMIRMELAELTDIKSLDFNIPERLLTVYHLGDYDLILKQLDKLNFGTSLVETVAAENYDSKTDDNTHQKALLWQVLGINFFFFVLEVITGVISNSMGLVADSLDMLADSLVYALALFAVGGTIARKKKIAGLAGYFQLILAAAGLIEVIRRFIGIETVPAFQTMIIISLLALAGNSLCLYLLQKSKSKDVHMKASMIFTSNDVIINTGVIIAGVLVRLTNSNYPDLVIGAIVFYIVGQGAYKILKLSK